MNMTEVLNSSLTSLGSDGTSNYIIVFDRWKEFKFISLGLLIHFGLICNSIALAVFATSNLKKTVPGRYFMALAFADNLVLVGELLLWLNHRDSRGPRLGLNFINENNFSCKVIYFTRYWARMLTSWITVTITLERFLTVTFPLRMMSYSSLRKPLIVVAIEAVVCAGLASFALFLIGVSARPDGTLLCSFQDSQFLFKKFLVPIVGVLGELILPSFLVLVFTILLIRNMARANASRRRHLAQEHGTNERQTTFALLAIAFMFLITRSPYMVTFFLLDAREVLKLNVEHIYIANTFAYVMAVVNYSFNFLLFCITGKTFRKELWKFCTCRASIEIPDSTMLSSAGYTLQNSRQ